MGFKMKIGGKQVLSYDGDGGYIGRVIGDSNKSLQKVWDTAVRRPARKSSEFLRNTFSEINTVTRAVLKFHVDIGRRSINESVKAFKKVPWDEITIKSFLALFFRGGNEKPREGEGGAWDAQLGPDRKVKGPEAALEVAPLDEGASETEFSDNADAVENAENSGNQEDEMNASLEATFPPSAQKPAEPNQSYEEVGLPWIGPKQTKVSYAPSEAQPDNLDWTIDPLFSNEGQEIVPFDQPLGPPYMSSSDSMNRHSENDSAENIRITRDYKAGITTWEASNAQVSLEMKHYKAEGITETTIDIDSPTGKLHIKNTHNENTGEFKGNYELRTSNGLQVGELHDNKNTPSLEPTSRRSFTIGPSSEQQRTEHFSHFYESLTQKYADNRGRPEYPPKISSSSVQALNEPKTSQPEYGADPKSKIPAKEKLPPPSIEKDDTFDTDKEEPSLELFAPKWNELASSKKHSDFDRDSKHDYRPEHKLPESRAPEGKPVHQPSSTRSESSRSLHPGELLRPFRGQQELRLLGIGLSRMNYVRQARSIPGRFKSHLASDNINQLRQSANSAILMRRNLEIATRKEIPNYLAQKNAERNIVKYGDPYGFRNLEHAIEVKGSPETEKTFKRFINSAGKTDAFHTVGATLLTSVVMAFEIFKTIDDLESGFFDISGIRVIIDEKKAFSNMEGQHVLDISNGREGTVRFGHLIPPET